MRRPILALAVASTVLLTACGKVTASTAASGSPGAAEASVSPAAPESLCRLPIDTIPGGGAGAFLPIPNDTDTSKALQAPPEAPPQDPSSRVTLPNGQAPTALAYDWRYHVWLPVSPNWVSPDGSWYAYADANARIHAVDVGTHADRLLSSSTAHVIINTANDGVYVANRDPQNLNVSGLSLLSRTGSEHRFASDGTWAFADGAAAWELAHDAGSPAPQPTAGGSWDTATGNILRRMDLATGAVSTWLNGEMRLLTVDRAGHPIVVGGVNSPVLLVQSPGSAVNVGGQTYVVNARSDTHGTWYVETMTIAVYLIAKNQSHAVARYGFGSTVRIAGDCA
jgi:hypothetical protein